MVKDGGNAAQDTTSRRLQSWLGVYLRGGSLQSGADAEPFVGDSLRISSGRSVLGRRKAADSGTQSPVSAHDKVVDERPRVSLSNYFISLLGATPNGPSPYGKLDALLSWVEEGKAPATLTAARRDLSG